MPTEAIRIVSVDRWRSGIVYPRPDANATCTVAFILKPYPDKVWCRLFDEISSSVADPKRGVAYVLNSGSYQRSYYGRARPGLWSSLVRSLRRWIRRRGGVTLRVTYPASENDVQRVFADANRLIHDINEAFERTVIEYDQRANVHAQYLAQFTRTIDELERERMKPRKWAWSWVRRPSGPHCAVTEAMLHDIRHDANAEAKSASKGSRSAAFDNTATVGL